MSTITKADPARQLFRTDLLTRRLVLIYQMPKIGSQTIETTLRGCGLPIQVLRFHYLSSAFADTLRHGLSSAQPDAVWRRDAQLQLDEIRHTSRSIRLRRFLRRCGFPVPQVEVITGVRELIGLMLASIFENFVYFAPRVELMTVDKCKEALLHPKTFKTLRDWFDLELKSFTGIDVFRKPFSYSLGHSVYENKFARVLVYRFESLSDLPQLLSRFLEWRIPALVSTNLSESKQYSQQYRDVKDRLQLPPDFVTSLLGTRMMQHFYSDQERQQFYLRWSGDNTTATSQLNG